MQSPGIIRANSRICIPELRLEKLSAGVDEAAAIGSDGAVVAGEWAVARTGGRVCERCVRVADRSRGSLIEERSLGEETAGKGEERAERDGVRCHGC